MTDGVKGLIGGFTVGFLCGLAVNMYICNHYLSLPKAEDIFRRAKSRAAAKAAYKHEIEKDTTAELR